MLLKSSPLKIGPYQIDTPTVLAPMAGVTDWPFREISRQSGAGLCISEMVTSKTELWHTAKSSTRLPSSRDPLPRPVQIAGAEPYLLAEAAKRCADMGAGIIDINMGCPAKKVCNRAAGSALLADEALVFRILETVVNAVDVPVTLKTRTGTDPENRNILSIAKQAENIGIQALSLHGRTRACKFKGQAEYDSIKKVVKHIGIPVIANGDINTPEQALAVKRQTGAAGIMIGRGAWGKPWIFNQITSLIATGEYKEPTTMEKQETCFKHLHFLHEFYEEYRAVRFSRKHVDWYLRDSDPEKALRRQFNQVETYKEQTSILRDHFEQLIERNTLGKVA